MRSLPVWMSVEIGGVSKDGLINLPKEGGFEVGNFASFMLKHENCKVRPTKEVVEVVRRRVGDILFVAKPTIIRLQRTIIEMGYSLCPPDLAPHLCSQLNGVQGEDEFFFMMRQIPNCDGEPSIFKIIQSFQGNMLVKTLHGTYACAETELHGASSILFVRKKEDQHG